VFPKRQDNLPTPDSDILEDVVDSKELTEDLETLKIGTKVYGQP
jgi:hypothetical protein